MHYSAILGRNSGSNTEWGMANSFHTVRFRSVGKVPLPTGNGPNASKTTSTLRYHQNASEPTATAP